MDLIAEFKRGSPFSDISYSQAGVEDVIPVYEKMGAKWISILFSEQWSGSISDIALANQISETPLLAKGILKNLEELEELKEAGADAILLISGYNLEFYEKAIQLGLVPFVEVHTIQEAQELQPQFEYVVVNARDLQTGEIDLSTHKRILPYLEAASYKVAASGLQRDSVVAGYDAILVGTSLMKEANSVKEGFS